MPVINGFILQIICSYIILFLCDQIHILYLKYPFHLLIYSKISSYCPSVIVILKEWKGTYMNEFIKMTEEFIKELEYCFDNDLYTAGKQIDLHAPFLFKQAGAPWLTQKWVRKILTEPIVQKYGTHNFFPESIFDRVYKTTPDGYLEEMDCDYGCMAAWYNMSALGLYQVCPGYPVYQLTAPVFSEISINPESTESVNPFHIEARNLSAENIYIQSATLNGNPLERSWITHEEITAGGNLVFDMGPRPNKNWGIAESK